MRQTLFIIGEEDVFSVVCGFMGVYWSRAHVSTFDLTKTNTLGSLCEKKSGPF